MELGNGKDGELPTFLQDGRLVYQAGHTIRILVPSLFCPQDSRLKLHLDPTPMPNLKRASLPPQTMWPVVIHTPALEELNFCPPRDVDAASLPQRLIPYIAGGDPTYRSLRQVRWFSAACTSSDQVGAFRDWLLVMPRLEHLEMTCLGEPEYNAANTETIHSNLVKELAYRAAWSTRLRSLSLNGFCFRIGDLTDFLEQRNSIAWPLANCDLVCPPLAATECKALHDDYEGLNFRHVSNHKRGPQLQQPTCSCPCTCVDGTCPSATQ